MQDEQDTTPHPPYPQVVLVGATTPSSRWRELCRALRRRPDLQITEVANDAASAAITALQPAVMIVDVAPLDGALLSSVMALHDASPASKMLLVGDVPTLDRATLLALAGLRVASYLPWSDVRAEVVVACLQVVLTSALLVGSRATMEELVAPLEARRTTRVPGLILSPAERTAARARSATSMSALTRRPATATLWESNPDLTALLRTICALAGLVLAVVATATDLLNAAAQAGPEDILVIDCARAQREDTERCLAVVTRTSRLIYLIHPDPRTVAAVQEYAWGPVRGLAPQEVGFGLVERWRLHVAAASMAEVPPRSRRAVMMERQAPVARLTLREQEIQAFLEAGLPYEEIARRLVISVGTVKAHVAHIHRKQNPDQTT